MERNAILRKWAGLLVLFSLLGGTPLYADLGDFGEEVEKEQEKGPDERDKRDDRKDSESDSDDEDSGFFDLFMIPFMLWAGFNMSTYYAPYPYADVDEGPSFAAHTFTVDFPGELKRDFGRIRTSGGVFIEGGDVGASFAASFSAMFYGILGPDFEYRWWGDRSGNLHSVRLGAVIPLIQTDPFTLGFPIAAAIYSDAFDLIGIAIGSRLTSYPFRPLSIEIQFGGVSTPELVLWEVAGRTGIHMSRLEVSAGYYGLILNRRILHTAEIGAALHW